MFLLFHRSTNSSTARLPRGRCSEALAEPQGYRSQLPGGLGIPHEKVRRSQAHVSKLLTMPSSSHKTAKEISDLIDSITEAIRAFTLLDRPVNTWDD